jgi:hypothetical protein
LLVAAAVMVALAGTMASAPSAGAGDETASATFRLTLRGDVDRTDAFAISVWVIGGPIANPDPPPDLWGGFAYNVCNPCAVGVYEEKTPAGLPVGTMLGYLFERYEDWSPADVPETLYRGTVTVTAQQQTRFFVYDYDLRLPNTAISAGLDASIWREWPVRSNGGNEEVTVELWRNDILVGEADQGTYTYTYDFSLGLPNTAIAEPPDAPQQPAIERRHGTVTIALRLVGPVPEDEAFFYRHGTGGYGICGPANMVEEWTPRCEANHDYVLFDGEADWTNWYRRHYPGMAEFEIYRLPSPDDWQTLWAFDLARDAVDHTYTYTYDYSLGLPDTAMGS